MYLPSRKLAPRLHPFFLRLGPDIVEFARVGPHQKVSALNYFKVEHLANLLMSPTLWRT